MHIRTFAMMIVAAGITRAEQPATLDTVLQEIRSLRAWVQTAVVTNQQINALSEKLRIARQRESDLRSAQGELERSLERVAEFLSQNEIELKVLQRKVIEDPSADVLLKAMYESIAAHKQQNEQYTAKLNAVRMELQQNERTATQVLAEIDGATQKLAVPPR